MAQMAGIGGFEATQDERTMATLAHALSILGFIAPLVIFLVKRQSRFVSFHALQALLWHIVYFVLAMVFMVAWFWVIIFTVVNAEGAKGPAPPAGIFVLIPLVWLGFMGAWVLTLVLAVVYSIKASQGEWAEIPLLGPLARRLLKMGPQGRVIG
jgi:uncharacterized membrane protein